MFNTTQYASAFTTGGLGSGQKRATSVPRDSELGLPPEND